MSEQHTASHPKLPGKASFIERLVLSTFFNVLKAIVSDPAKAEEWKEYLSVARDELNAAYPPDEQ